MKLVDLGLQAYASGLKQQEEAHHRVSETNEGELILCEHKHVYTFGKRANTNNLLINDDFLKSIDAEVFETERGGDITYHGPGQLVGYPILPLREWKIGVKNYVAALETAIITALDQFQIRAYQIEGLTGIWVGEEGEVKRKIGAIGIRVKQGVSMHGFALNVSTDLSYFQHIVPCGISDKAVTSIANEVGKVEIEDVKVQFRIAFEEQIQRLLPSHI